MYACSAIVDMVNWKNLEDDVGVWGRENFGEQPATNPFLGTAEEFGELVEYLLTEDVQAGSTEELDAIGDVLVFFADYCSRHGISYQDAANQRAAVELETSCDSIESLCVEITMSRGNQAYSLLKQLQGIRLERDGVGKEADEKALAHTLCAIESFATARGYTLDDAVEEAWGEVKEREWDSSYTN